MISNREIKNFFENVNLNNPVFRGVYASDQIPDLEPGPSLIVVFTEKFGVLFGHFIVIGVDANGTMLFFDSFGRGPTEFNKNISDYTSKFRSEGRFYHNNICFQHPESTVCGYYCIFVILRLMEGLQISDIIKELKECENSDKYVEEQVKARCPGAFNSSFLYQICRHLNPEYVEN